MTISEETRQKLMEKGASLVGFADLSEVPEQDRHGFRYGINSILGGLELLPLVKPLWEGLREHHAAASENFSESIRQRSFEDRAKDFTGKAGNHTFMIELVTMDKTKLPVGYCISSMSSDSAGEVESIFIQDIYRGLHIGDLLMKHALDWMDSQNATTKRISVLAGNDVLKFYEKYGFKVRSHILEQVELKENFRMKEKRGEYFMLADLIKQGFGEKEDLNCAEKILQAANIAYDLGLDKEALKLASGFGGGMAIEDKCGALTASIMVLGRLFVKDRAHENSRIKELTKELFEEYHKEMGSIDCAPLKEKHRTEELKCRNVILKASEVLDRIVKRELSFY